MLIGSGCLVNLIRIDWVRSDFLFFNNLISAKSRVVESIAQQFESDNE